MVRTDKPGTPPPSTPPAGIGDLAAGLGVDPGVAAQTQSKPGASTPDNWQDSLPSGSHSTSTPIYTGTFAYTGGTGQFGSPRPTAAYANDLEAAWLMPDSFNKYLDQATRDQITALAKALGGRSGSALWQRAIDTAAAAARQGQQITPYQVLQGMAEQAGVKPVGTDQNGPGSGPSGGGSGSSRIPEADIRDLANKVGMAMIGRGLNEREFARVLGKVRGFEGSPDASAAGVNDVVENVVAQNPQYLDYQKATTMMGWFEQALAARAQNG